MFTTPLFLSLLFPLVLGNSTTRPLTVHERRDAAPQGFTLKSAASTEQRLTLRIGLVQNNIAGLVNALHDVSDPASEKYGQHLSKQEVRFVSIYFPEEVDDCERRTGCMIR